MTYQPQSLDTSEQADRFYFSLLAQRTIAQRLMMANNLHQTCRRFSVQAYQQRFPELTTAQLANKLATVWLGDYYSAKLHLSDTFMSSPKNPIELAPRLVQLFHRFDLDYYITGVFAAIAYGESRTTDDLDIVVSINPNVLLRVVEVLEQNNFYVSGVDDVLRGRMKMFRIIEQDSIVRADLIVLSEDRYEQIKFERRQCTNFDDTNIYLISPEDLVISKLKWRKHSQSEKQWRDILGVLKTQQAQLDYAYLRRWAGELQIAEDLESALRQAGIDYNSTLQTLEEC